MEVKSFKTKKELDDFIEFEDIEVIDIIKEKFTCFGEIEINFRLTYK